MRDRFFNLLGQRAQTYRAEFLNSSTAVLTALAASAVICGGIFVLSLAKVAPAVRVATTEIPPAIASIPQGPLGELTLPQTSPEAPTAEAAAPTGAVPQTLPVLRPDSLAALDTDTPPLVLHEVIEGRPPLVPGLRPAALEQLAAAQNPALDAASLAAIRPVTRPEAEEAAAPAPDFDAANDLAVSLLPRNRPADLDTTSQLTVARAPAPQAVEEPAAEVTLAALPTPSANPGPGFDRNANACSRRLAREIPRRPGSAASGSQFIATLAGVSGTTRDAHIAREVLRGNVPAFMRDLAPVSFNGVLPNGRTAQITICVTPDYLAVGSDRDYVRVPLGLTAAGRIADEFGMMLPTTRMVDAIYAQADLRLSPSPMTPGSQMSSTNYFMQHDATVDQQYSNAGGRLGMLVSGHKKDLVLTNRLARSPGRVAIYGWHRRNGSPIQPLSTVHGAEYADYSHGIRLVSRTAFVNGRAVDLESLLMDGTYASILNSEGAISRPAIQLASR